MIPYRKKLILTLICDSTAFIENSSLSGKFDIDFSGVISLVNLNVVYTKLSNMDGIKDKQNISTILRKLSRNNCIVDYEDIIKLLDYDIFKDIINDSEEGKLLVKILTSSTKELEDMVNQSYDNILNRYANLEFLKFNIKSDEVQYETFKLEDRDIRVPKGKTIYYSKMLKDILTAVYNKKVKVHSNFGYTQNRSYYDMIYQVVGKRFVCKIDIKKFFDSITKNTIKNILCEKHGISLNGVQEINKILYGSTDNFPTGSQVSPILSNLILYYLDMRFNKMIDDVIYARYSDDITLASNDENKLVDTIYNISTYLKSLGFDIKKEKFKIYDTTKDVPVLFKTKIVGNKVAMSEEKIDTFKKYIDETIDKCKKPEHISDLYNNLIHKVEALKTAGSTYDLNICMDYIISKTKYLIDNIARLKINYEDYNQKVYMCPISEYSYFKFGNNIFEFDYPMIHYDESKKRIEYIPINKLGIITQMMIFGRCNNFGLCDLNAVSKITKNGTTETTNIFNVKDALDLLLKRNFNNPVSKAIASLSIDLNDFNSYIGYKQMSHLSAIRFTYDLVSGFLESISYDQTNVNPKNILSYLNSDFVSALLFESFGLSKEDETAIGLIRYIRLNRGINALLCNTNISTIHEIKGRISEIINSQFLSQFKGEVVKNEKEFKFFIPILFPANIEILKDIFESMDYDAKINYPHVCASFRLNKSLGRLYFSTLKMLMSFVKSVEVVKKDILDDDNLYLEHYISKDDIKYKINNELKLNIIYQSDYPLSSNINTINNNEYVFTDVRGFDSVYTGLRRNYYFRALQIMFYNGFFGFFPNMRSMGSMSSFIKEYKSYIEPLENIYDVIIKSFTKENLKTFVDIITTNDSEHFYQLINDLISDFKVKDKAVYSKFAMFINNSKLDIISLTPAEIVNLKYFIIEIGAVRVLNSIISVITR